MKYILGNWKQFKTNVEAITYFKILKKNLKRTKSCANVGLAIPYSALSLAKKAKKSCFCLAQNISAYESGAYTSQISYKQVIQFNNVIGSLVGHSECRSLLNDSDALINTKVKTLLSNNAKCVLCIGETKAEYTAKKTLAVLEKQLISDLKDINANLVTNLIVAYEPIWAIGTGLTASTELANSICGKIKLILKKIFKNDQLVDKIKVLYGGSVKLANSQEILKQNNIDGVLIGGASLDPVEFAKIVKSAN